MTNFLVTGANGFVGYHLCTRLSFQEDVKTYGVDLGDQQWRHPAFDYRKADMGEADFEKYLPDNIHVVIHLAQSPRYRDFPEGAEDMMRVNVNGTFRLLEWARKTGVRKFIFASTGNVYAPSKEPVTEEHSCHAGSFYAATKLSAEQFTEQYSKYFSVIVLRLFGVYGPGQKNMLIPNIIDRIRKGEKITLAQNAGLYITPIFISDLTEIILKLVALNITGKFETLNIAGNEILPLKEIAENISEILKLPLIADTTHGEPVYLLGSNEKLKKMISADCIQTSFKNGIREVLQYGNKSD